MEVSTRSLHCKRYYFPLCDWSISWGRDVETMQIPIFFSNFCPLILAPILLATITVVATWWWFCSFLIPCTLIGILYGRVVPSYLFISVLICGYFTLWVIIQYDHYLFCCSNWFRVGLQKLHHVDACVLSICPHPFPCTSLLTGTKRCSRLILYFLCPSCGINHFFKRILVPFIGEEYLETKFWVLGE